MKYDLIEGRLAIADGEESIDFFDIYSCDAVSAFIPASVRVIHRNEFSRLTRLERIEVDPASPYFKAVDGVLYTSDGIELVAWPVSKGNTAVVPEGVERIGDGAFQNAESMESVQLPSSLKSIGDAAFEHTARLHEVSLPEGVEEIGKDAICAWHNMIGSGLHALSLPSTLKRVGENAFPIPDFNAWSCPNPWIRSELPRSANA